MAKKTLKSNKPAAPTIKRLANSASAAMKKASEVDAASKDKVLSSLEKESNAGLVTVRKIAKEALVPDGLSPLGHKISAMNGFFDKTILEIDGFDKWVVEVCKAGCATRRSDPKENGKFVARLQSHLKFLSGRKQSGIVGMPRDLDKVGLSEHTKEVMDALVPVSKLFDIYVKNGKF